MQGIFSIIANTSDGVLAVDHDRHVAYCNEAAGDLLNVSPATVVGQPCFEIVAGRDEQGRAHCGRNCRAMVMAGRGQLIPSCDLRSQANGGDPVWLSVSTVLVPSQWGHIAVLIHFFRNVNRQKEIERNVGQLLECAQRLLELQHEDRDCQIPSSSPHPTDLTKREREVLRLLASGNSTGAMAQVLCISSATVRNHVQNILSKLRVHTRLEAVTLALRNGSLQDH